MDDRCPHKGGPLSEGIVHGRQVTCPLHNWVFDMDTGEAQGADGPRRDLSGQDRRGPRTFERVRAPQRDARRDGDAGSSAFAARRDAAIRTRTTCPYCGVGCGVLAMPTRRWRASRSLATPITRPTAAGSAPRAARLARPSASKGRLLHSAIGGARRRWDEALDLVAGDFAETIAEHGPDSRGLLCLGPDADRGLLRRQQADEGLHRQRQYRHEFKALHGLLGRRASPRLRHRHGAGPL